MRTSIALLICGALTSAACGKKSEGGTSGEPAKPASNDPGKPQVKAPEKAPSRGPEHALYSLVDNRLSAHLIRGGGLVLPAGSAGFAKYVRFGNTRRIKQKPWEMRQELQGVKAARMNGKSAKVEVPLTAQQIDPSIVRVRVWSEKEEPFSVRVNGNKDVNGKAGAGWSTVELQVPAGQLKEGENELLFFARSGDHPVAWIEVGGASAPADDAVGFYDASSKSLVIPDGGGMAWYAFVPEKGKLTGDLADGACTIKVKATGEDGTSADGALTGLGSAVDLSSLAGKAARIELDASGCAKAQLANASIVVPGDAPAKPARGTPPKYVVLFIMDSLRADRVRPWNPNARPETPEFEKLAETGAVFMQHYDQGNESRVSHASIWTALYPLKHTFIDEKASLPEKWKTVDEVAKDAGMFVAGVSANGYIRPKRGFGTAWNKFSNHIEEETGLKAADIIEHGLQFVGNKKEPWFLYLGTVDTHVSWRAKAPWMAKYDPGSYSGRFKDQFSGEDAGKAAGSKEHNGGLTDREIQHVRALYDSNVSYQDDQLRQLVEKLQAAGMWDQTMLIVTADHGDEQWEEGRVGHGSSVRDMLVHVPLLIHYPPMFPAGKIAEGTEGIDIVPTIADALGVAMDPEWQGVSLIPLANGIGRGYPLMSVSSMYEDAHGPRISHWKMKIAGGNTPRLYDLSHDPDEMKDLWGQASAEIGARAVLDPVWMLRAFNLDWKKSQWGNEANVSSRFASDLGE
ncbi:MAG TPA: sulfatase [Kofleriaceae bacterium]|nr:sulfatase [Kofleriaceae bacterium]